MFAEQTTLQTYCYCGGVYTCLCDNLKSSSVSIDGEELSYRAEDCVLKRTITSGVFG